MSDWKDREIGALWKIRGKNGEDFYSGEIKDKETGKLIKFVGYKNKYKSEQGHPDIRLYTSIEKKNENKQ